MHLRDITSRHAGPISGFVLLAILTIGCRHDETSVTNSARTTRQKQAPVIDSGGTKQHAETTGEDNAASYPPLFQGWQKPDLTLVLTGRQNGYMEPCGCTGLDNAKGGLSRRHSLLQQLREEKEWNVAALDAGNQIRRFGLQAEIKFQRSVDLLRQVLQYQAIGFGPDDLRLSIGEVIAAVAGDDSPYVCANVNLLDLLPRFRVIDQGGVKVAVTTILGIGEQEKVGNVDEIVLQNPQDALSEVLPLMKQEACDFLVLLAYASLDESRSLAEQFGEFDFVVSTGGADEPPAQFESIANSKTKFIELGGKGMYVGVVGLYMDASPSIRFQRVPLDARFSDSPPVMEVFHDYQRQLQTLGIEGLGLRPVPHPDANKFGGNRFVGSEVCRDCHEYAFEVYESTPHFQATADIANPTERSEIQRHYDPECLSCHVTGWNPQGFFPYQSGYLSLEQSKHLHGVGCENCHGPGSAHVAAENGDVELTDKQIFERRLQMRLTLKEAEEVACIACHDLDNSPKFEFADFWDQIKHYTPKE